MERSLRLTVKSLLRILLAVSWLSLVIMTVYAMTRGLLDRKDRLIILCLSTIPVVSFVLGHALYEAQARLSVVGSAFMARSFLSLGVLLIPATLIITKYDLPGDVAGISNWIAIGIVLGFVSSNQLLDVSGSHGFLVKSLGHVKYIMVDAWRSKEQQIDSSTASEVVEKMKEARSRCYHDPEGLRMFQATLRTQYADSREAAGLIVKRWTALGGKAPKSIKILDVGGGDGVFTAELLRQLREKCGDKCPEVSGITVVDPVNWRETYEASLSPLVPAERLNFEVCGIQNYSTLEAFEMVIASHSLYAPIDNAVDRRSEARGIIERIRSYRAIDTGIVVMVMASRFGLSYEFKQEALRHLLGGIEPDVAAEDLNTVLYDYEHTIVDSPIVLTSIFEDRRKGDKEPLASWLTYFLRVPIRASKPIEVEELAELLEFYSQPMRTLGEYDKHRYLAFSPAIGGQDIVLPHKTSVWVSR